MKELGKQLMSDAQGYDSAFILVFTDRDAALIQKAGANTEAEHQAIADHYIGNFEKNGQTGRCEFLYCFGGFVNYKGCTTVKCEELSKVEISQESSTPTATPIPASRSLPDYSTYFGKVWTTPESTVVQPFIRSTNERGNDVYTGVMQNTTHPHRQFNVVTEFPRSKDQTIELYNKYIADKTNEGFTARPDIVAQWKAKYDYAQGPNANLWVGERGSQQFYVWTQYVTADVNAWQLVAETLN